MKYRLVIKDLNTDDRVVVKSDQYLNDARVIQRRFTKLKWEERRPGVFTIDHIVLIVEPDEKSRLL